jgi:hypothetical protein
VSPPPTGQVRKSRQEEGIHQVGTACSGCTPSWCS